MEELSLKKRNGYLVIGGIGAVFSAGYLGMAIDLPFGRLSQPGPALFPILVGATLFVSSVITIWEGLRLSGSRTVDMPFGADLKRLLTLIFLLFGYFFALPWLGQIIVSMLFCTLLMRALSDLSWPRILLYSLTISATLHLVFVHYLKVQMPRGILTF